MADVTLDLQNLNSKELFGQGVKAYVLQDFDTAVKAFSRVSELLATEHGSDTHDSLGDVYLYYGKSLLEVSRRDSGPLGDGVLKNVEEESEEEVGESDGEEEKTEEESKTNGETEDEKKDEGEKTDEAKPEEKKAEEAKPEEEKTDEAKPEEDAAKPEETSEEPSNSEEAGNSTEKKEGEDAEDLQVAWEVLELAKTIFKSRGADGRKNLAETLIVLGEISLESGNFPSAIEDMKEGLEIQKTLFGNDSRTIAETYYKLGGALSTNGQIDEAIESFTSSYEYLNNKINSLKKDEEHKEANAEEIEELSGLIPEVQEKIADMKNLKAEVAKKVTASTEAAPSKNGQPEASAASSSKQVNDISHLVKRKRKEDEDTTSDENPAKKPSP